MSLSETKAVAFRIQVAKKNFGPTVALGIEQPKDQPLNIYRGSTTAILGLSGSGKSTFLSLLGLLEEPNKGAKIAYCPVASPDQSLDYAELSSSQKIALRSTEFGVAFQDGHLIGHLSVTENIKLPLSLTGSHSKEANQVSNQLASQLGISHREAARPKELSGGEYQRVAIARAMSHNPTVIFADELTGNLDTDTGSVVMDMLDAWRRQSEVNTLILVTHDIQQAYKYADQFIIFENGKVKCTCAKAELDAPNQGKWRNQFQIASSMVGRDVLLKLLEVSSGKTGQVEYPKWNRLTNQWHQIGYLFWYGLLDLFPIRFFPFNWSVFQTTLRDTVFSLLTILSVAMLVTVLLLGYGIFHGVNKYQHETQTRDIRANRLIVEIETSSKVSEIDDNLVADLKKQLQTIYTKPGLFDRIFEKVLPGYDFSPQPAVQDVEGFSNAELFVFKSAPSSDMVGAIGTTVPPNSLLLSRLTYQGKKLTKTMITDYNTEGIIVKASWLKSILKLTHETFPNTVRIQYGQDTEGTSQEELMLLGVVDNLPDGVFLISPGNWHKIRDRTWRSNHRSGRVLLSSKVTPALLDQLNASVKRLANSAVVHAKEDQEGSSIEVDCGCEGGWRTVYWQNTVYAVRIKPLLQEAGITTPNELALFNPTAGGTPLSSKLTYSNAAVYLADIGAVEEVARTIREHEARLGVDKYIENAYKWIHQTTQLSALILGVIAMAAFFLSTVNLFLMFYQTVLRKRHEIGILKAFGSSGLRIATIFFVESFYISLIGCTLGLLIANEAGTWAGDTLKAIYELAITEGGLFYLDWQIVTAILFAVVMLNLSVTYLATFNMATKTSNELLRQRD